MLTGMTHGTPREDRYAAKVDRRSEDECWPWLAGHNRCGYGTFRGDGGEQLAHRYGYKLAHGPIPVGLCVCHACDNPECQNPSHWFLGTPADNMADRDAKGRHGVNSVGHHGVTFMSGEESPASKLKAVEVKRILALYQSGISQGELASRFGVAQQTVGKIVQGKRWVEITGGRNISQGPRAVRGERNVNARITYAIAGEIRNRYSVGGVSQQSLAAEYGIAQTGVSRIVRGLGWVK